MRSQSNACERSISTCVVKTELYVRSTLAPFVITSRWPYQQLRAKTPVNAVHSGHMLMDMGRYAPNSTQLICHLCMTKAWKCLPRDPLHVSSRRLSVDSSAVRLAFLSSMDFSLIASGENDAAGHTNSCISVRDGAWTSLVSASAFAHFFASRDAICSPPTFQVSLADLATVLRSGRAFPAREVIYTSQDPYKSCTSLEDPTHGSICFRAKC